MRTVRVIYREEAEGWWAESPDVSGYTAADNSLDNLRDLVPEGISEFLEEPVLVIEAGSDFEKGMTTSSASTSSFNAVGTMRLLPRANFTKKTQDSTEAGPVFGPPRFVSA